VLGGRAVAGAGLPAHAGARAVACAGRDLVRLAVAEIPSWRRGRSPADRLDLLVPERGHARGGVLDPAGAGRVVVRPGRIRGRRAASVRPGGSAVVADRPVLPGAHAGGGVPARPRLLGVLQRRTGSAPGDAPQP